MSTKRVILYGTGEFGEDAWFNLTYGEKTDILYVYDDYDVRDSFHGIKFIDKESLIRESQSYPVVVAEGNDLRRLDIVSFLKKESIRYELYHPDPDIPQNSLHGYGVYPDIMIKANVRMGANSFAPSGRARDAADMFLYVMKRYDDLFAGKQVDFWMSLWDLPEQTAIRIFKGWYFSYTTTYAYKEEAIPVPDYRACFNQETYPYPETAEACRQAASEKWTDPRAFWIGTIGNNRSRGQLLHLGEKHPDILDIRNRDALSETYRIDGSNDFIPMLSWCKYKYLLCLPGHSWADRTKTLLQMGRPVLMVDMIYKEWFFDDLTPMKDFVPIRPDLSDLLEKIALLDENEALYNEIVNNAFSFSERHFLPDKICEYVRDVLVQYALRE